MAVWEEFVNSAEGGDDKVSLYANYLPQGASWDPASLVVLDSLMEDVSQPGIVFLANGDAVASWQQVDPVTGTGQEERVFAAVFDKTTQTWGPAQAVNEDASTPALMPRIQAFQDRAVVTYAQKRAQGNPGASPFVDLYAREWNGTTQTWGPSYLVLLEQETGDITQHSLGLGRGGKAFSVFIKDNPGGNVLGATFDVPIDIPEFTNP